MNNDEAKKILALFRPGTPDRTDPSFNEALDQAKSFKPAGRWQDKPDPELGIWFQKHCSSYLSIKSKFQSIPVPAGLKDQILAEIKPEPEKIIQFRPMVWLAAAAAVAVCLSLGALFVKSHGHDDFDTYRSRMTRTALEPYAMNLQSHDPEAVNTFLAGRKAPTDYVLPGGVAKAQLVGCAVLEWQGQPVSMVCFKSGKPLRNGESSDLWLFVIDQSSLRDAPAGSSPELTRVMKLSTATWTRDGKTYVLAGDGNEDFLRQYL